MSDAMYIPETCAEALSLWDAAEQVTTVEMGGMGEGYELAIQNLAFELIRAWHSLEWPAVGAELPDDYWNAREKESDAIIDRMDKEWGYSGAQVGAARNLAALVCRRGYRAALSMPQVQDRLIKSFKTTAADAISRLRNDATPTPAGEVRE